MSLIPSESKPDLKSLVLFKWKDENGVQQKERVIKRVSADWRDIGILLGLSVAELKEYTTLESVGVFNYWIENGGHPDYPLSWEGLCDLLCDIDHDNIADNVKAALASQGL